MQRLTQFRIEVKPIGLMIICAAAVLMLTACGKDEPGPKERVLEVFEQQQERLLRKIEHYIAGDEVTWDNLEGVQWVRAYHTYRGEIIEFECIAEGLVTSSFQAGFYYAPDDEPTYVGWFLGSRLDELLEDGDGWSYSDGTDKRYYTERICENFYYYTESNQAPPGNADSP